MPKKGYVNKFLKLSAIDSADVIDFLMHGLLTRFFLFSITLCLQFATKIHAKYMLTSA